MFNFYKLIELIVSVQLLVITTMLPVYIPLQFIDKSINNFDIPITWQLPTIILLTIIFNKKIVFRMMCEIICADGLIDPFESNLIRRLSGLLYISDKDAGIIKKQVMKKKDM